MWLWSSMGLNMTGYFFTDCLFTALQITAKTIDKQTVPLTGESESNVSAQNTKDQNLH